jgi:3-methylfumaryl-CoA hydratase
MMPEYNIDKLQNWVGRSETVEDVISLATIENMNATLGRASNELKVGDPLPPSWQWLFFNRGVAPDSLGRDGHVAKSNFAPPMPLPRRMWAGNKVEVTKSLTIGQPAKRLTVIEEITEKNGRSGQLVFLRERSEITDENGGSLIDRRTIVFRADAGQSEAPKVSPARTDAAWQQKVEPDPVLLFRYSALTFNSHRIHYDREYTTGVEGYPALLVHGPLTATLLMNLLRQEMPTAMVRDFNVRAMAPLFDNKSFSVNGKPTEDGTAVHLWAATAEGDLAMTIDVTLG